MAYVKFKCNKQQFFTIAQAIFNSCNQYLPQFASFKSKYNPAFIANTQALINTCQNKPNIKAIQSDFKVTRIKLLQYNKQSLQLFQILKLYIAEAYPKQTHSIQFQAAGQQYYFQAGRPNWKATAALLNSANLYVAQNLSVLTANKNMPLTFPAQLNNMQQIFETTLQQFYNAEENAHIQTQQNNHLYNQLYQTIINLCSDAKIIFRNQPAQRNLFVINSLLKLITNKPSATTQNNVNSNSSTILHFTTNPPLLKQNNFSLSS